MTNNNSSNSKNESIESVYQFNPNHPIINKNNDNHSINNKYPQEIIDYFGDKTELS